MSAAGADFAGQFYQLNEWLPPFRVQAQALLAQEAPLARTGAALAALLRSFIPRMELVQGLQAEALAVLLEADVLRSRRHVQKALDDYLEFAQKHQI